MSFTPLKNLMNASVQRAGIKDDVEASLVVDAAQKIFNEMFGEEIGKAMKPLYVKRGVLTVSCVSSVAAQELKLREREILKKLKDRAPKSSVERLRFFAWKFCDILFMKFIIYCFIYAREQCWFSSVAYGYH